MVLPRAGDVRVRTRDLKWRRAVRRLGCGRGVATASCPTNGGRTRISAGPDWSGRAGGIPRGAALGTPLGLCERLTLSQPIEQPAAGTAQRMISPVAAYTVSPSPGAVSSAICTGASVPEEMASETRWSGIRHIQSPRAGNPSAARDRRTATAARSKARSSRRLRRPDRKAPADHAARGRPA